MYWIITDADPTGGEPQRIGHGYLPFSNAGPGLRTVDQRKTWVADYLASHGAMFPYEWATFDDDGEPVYSGRCGDLDQADQDNAFAPLDFSTADCGATEMRYRKVGTTKWETL